MKLAGGMSETMNKKPDSRPLGSKTAPCCSSRCKKFMKDVGRKPLKSVKRLTNNSSVSDVKTKRLQLEQELTNFGEKIEDLNNVIVDLDDDINSAYLRQSRMVERLVTSFKVFTKSTGCSYEVQPTVSGGKLEGVAPSEIRCAVSNFLEEQDVSSPLKFEDIKKVVDEISDPADQDEELKGKLLDNQRMQKTDKVVENFILNYKHPEEDDEEDDDDDIDDDDDDDDDEHYVPG